MDTSGLASSLSLAGFLLVFAYLSLAQRSGSSAAVLLWPPQLSGRLQFAYQFLRITAVVAIALSTQAVLLSQTKSPSIGVIALSSVPLVAFLIGLDLTAKLLSSRFPNAISQLTLPVRAPIMRLSLLRRNGAKSGVEPDLEDTNGPNGIGPGEEDEIGVVITEEQQAGLDSRERLMIRSILRLDESIAREVMVPRVDIVAVDANTPLIEVSNLMLECTHSRIPVFKETVDNIVGVVYSRDLLPYLGTKENYPSLEEIMKPAFFIPESKRLDELLQELQEKRIHLAIVVDEYGGVEGLVTLEDLLEEIVGEIEDEFSRTMEPRVVPMASGEVIVDARVTLDYVSNLCSTVLEHEDVDTVGGLVYSSLGKMPQVGDEVFANGLRIEVVSLLGRRLRKLKLSKTETKTTE